MRPIGLAKLTGLSLFLAACATPAGRSTDGDMILAVAQECSLPYPSVTRVEVIDPWPERPADPVVLDAWPVPRLEDDSENEPRVMAMLFADAVGYSKLTEEQVPRFVQHFLARR